MNNMLGWLKRINKHVAIIVTAMVLLEMGSIAFYASPIDASPANIGESAVVCEAFTWIGVPYQWGWESKCGVDCSGLVRQVYMRASKDNAYYFDRTAAEIKRVATPTSSPRPGDVILFTEKATGKCSHVGIYIDGATWNANFVHAGSFPGKVVQDRLYYSPWYGTGWWSKNYSISFARYNPDYYLVCSAYK
jgi:cell wall-associated NlpC family hydrolase